ncbi:NAD-dependent malic enzyme [Candidatus Izimaplasma bacterium HR1]|jgi:malate dehydrogenase (oxaloacetate-decarboxylating)|uniref:NAD(P)-dependent malic enzyme n=1 Tax=Candidatus Izimoplasma sp. HR1 TaxID=1541959 RepID=UPI0004F8329C|nr:NAD-dependent malic enzyme [Candidatus Izimaplasma bacterium HR1]
MKDLKERSLKLHEEHNGKISVISKVRVENKDDLSLAYSPGVAEPCREIQRDRRNIYKYTSKGNMVAVVSDGSAVLGLGEIGPYAGLPVMEGKAILFKEFANVDAFPIMVDTTDPDEIIELVKNISPTFGGINLEDIKAPKCVYIERRLKEELDIPVFHDDQHGTAIVTSAALINACKLTNKSLNDLEVVISGTGAAGSSIAKLLHEMGIKNLYGYNRSGVILESKYNNYSFLEQELLDGKVFKSPRNLKDDSLKELIKNKDVFIGVSAKGILTKEMVKTMNQDPFIFAMANPDPEISYEEAIEAGAYIVGTGRSDYPNQINNVLAFPGLFRGALDAKSTKITESMKIVSAKAIADIIEQHELTNEYIIPSAFDKRVVERVSKAVYDEVIKLGINRT